MKIVVCGSMRLSKRMVEIEKELIEQGHTVILPPFAKRYAELDSEEAMHSEAFKNKIQHNLIEDYYNRIKEGDAILIVNETIKGIENYVGGNSFLEMGFAYVLGKKKYLINPIPQMMYTDELIAMQPTILNGDLTKISSLAGRQNANMD